MENKIGCNTGRVTIIDPNDTGGYNSSSNMTVPLEELNISVVLKTFRKGRTVLSKDKEGGAKESSQTVAINFIEGSELGGEKSLTTKYTDLTTVFEQGTINSETLGISSIDVDFNPSMAPMITINFIDVRGSSIFQNEESISGNNSGNKYSTFFQLPYPLFELEIKGYYGMPVTYCLHMLKFTSKFNSKTGNFEIQCQFIGYTYAMMSDLLIGYMKAIPYTKIGGEKYAEYNKDKTNKILNLNELMKAIGEINGGIKKISNTSESAKTINSIKELKTTLELIRGNLNSLGNILNYIPSEVKEEFTFIVKINTITDDMVKNAISNYNDGIKTNIENFNAISGEIGSLSIGDFNNLTSVGVGKGLHLNLTIDKLIGTDNDANLLSQIGSSEGVTNFKKELLEFIRRYYPNQTGSFVFDVYDLRNIYTTVKKTEEKIKIGNKNIQEKLADELKDNFRTSLGFEPTVRNIIETFTVAIEIMMETIYTVSTKAEAMDNTERVDELSKVFTKDLVKSSDIKNLGQKIQSGQIFAWPDYKEADSKGNYIDKYLGDPGVLENPFKVTELEFIDDLLKAFIKAQEEANEVEEAVEAIETTWYPVNPLDTMLYNEKEPYKRVEFGDEQQIIRVMVQRGMAFLAYSNGEILTDDEIKLMAEIEVDAVIRGVENKTLLQALSQTTLKSFLQVKIDSGHVFDYLIREWPSTKTYFLDYPKPEVKDVNGDTYVIPISDSFFGGIKTTNFDLTNKVRWDYANNSARGTILLTNYNADRYSGNRVKTNDGCMYMKIIKPSDFTNSSVLPTTSVTVKNESIFDLEKLKSSEVNASAGYNTFGGSFGIQEYNKMNFGGTIAEKLPLMYVFYRNTTNGLSLNRSDSGKISENDKNKPNTSNYDFNIKGDYLNLSKGKSNFYMAVNKKDMHLGLGQTREHFATKVAGNTSMTYPYFEQPAFNQPITTDNNKYRDFNDQFSFSLFGSKFYYAQSKQNITTVEGDYVSFEQYNKAFLFLNNLPWNIDYGTPFRVPEIINLFNQKAGFIHAPRLWCAWLGSILWRLNITQPSIENGKIIGGGSSKNDPIFWTKNGVGKFSYGATEKNPRRDQYLQFLDWGKNIIPLNYNEILPDDFLMRLPEQVKDEFTNSFLSFVNGTDSMITWDEIRNELEIFDGTGDEFNSFVVSIRASIDVDTLKIPKTVFNNSAFKNGLNKKAYSIITPIVDSFFDGGITTGWHDDYLALELAGDYKSNSAVKILIDSMAQEVIISNNNPKIWGEDKKSLFNRERIETNPERVKLYFNKVVEILKTKADSFSPAEAKKKIEQQIFGTTDESVIKLILYTTCKNIQDKWLAGATDPNNLIFQCGDSSGKSIRSSIDTEIATKSGRTSPRLIDSFRFVSRSFKDIGDKLFINPIPVNDFLVKSPNTSAYDAISSLLDANKFTFDALPTFINYKDPDNLKAIFTPMPSYTDAVRNGSCGPTFVCVYAGQTSKHLDFQGSEYQNDGFDFGCDAGIVDIPKDFIDDIGGGEDPVAVFKVSYGQQNQNIFKDITLDQSEFSETDESLQIQDDISQKGAQTNRSLAGQNIYNVYSVRSYSAQVEMMGNAMIQPMMYFQMDNIPMFHGAYMITRVKHSITPNNMVTNFTGTRIRYSETPLITAYDLFMSLADSLDTEKAGTGKVSGTSSSFKPGSFPPIVRTIIENGGLNGNIQSNNIKLSKVLPIPMVGLTASDKQMLDEATGPLKEMLTAFVSFAGDNNYPKINGNYINISSLYRSQSYQQKLYDGCKADSKCKDGSVAKPGTSNHSWGIAVDLQMVVQENSGQLVKGSYTPIRASAVKDGYNLKANPSLKWFMDNSYKYGFIIPKQLRDGVGVDEFWHFEYHGTSAKCLFSELPSIYGYTPNLNGEYKPIVTNPKNIAGQNATYTPKDCGYEYVKGEGDGSISTNVDGDFWSLVAICSLEAAPDQARADVAQSIYNRFNTPNKPYGKTIKEIITKEKQYEPVFKNRKDWLAIQNEETAIIAVQNSKGITREQSRNFITTTKNAITNPEYQLNAINYIGTRTEFLGYYPKNKNAKSVVNRGKNNNFHYWQYGGISLIGATASIPSEISNNIA